MKNAKDNLVGRAVTQVPLLSLNEIKNRYSSLRDMARDLARFPEFTRISPSTVFRWLQAEAKIETEAQIETDPKKKKQKRGKHLSLRAQRAIRVLSTPPPQKALKVAYPMSPFSLPMILLEFYLQDRPPTFQPMNFEPMLVATGHEALCALVDGHADVAISYRHFDRTEKGKDYSQYARLSSFCRYFVKGVGTKQIHSRKELPRIRFGYPQSSGVGAYLPNVVPFESFGDFAPKPFDGIPQAVEMLFLKKIDYVLAAQPVLAKIRAEMFRSHPTTEIYEFKSSLLPPAEFDLFVNTMTLNPLAVFSLLDNLAAIIDNLEKAFSDLSVKDQDEALARTLGYSKFEELRSAIIMDKDTKPEEIAYEFALDRFVSLNGLLALCRRLAILRS